ncbi:MAG: NAD(+) diphosphatase [Gemmatimonadetes bacterium]|nr:NAD(+) diphosphatase [Gemmatimonadota bacterium]
MRHLTVPAIDRLDLLRAGDDALTPATRVLTFDAGGTAILIRRGSRPVLATRTLGELPRSAENLTVLLGEHAGVRWAARAAPEAEHAATRQEGEEFAGVRAAASSLAAFEAGLVVYGAGLLAWHRRAQYCGVCGGTTDAGHSGHQRACGGCGAVQFPRTDPAVITLIRRGGRCLLINQPAWPKDRFAAVAGFVEPGETLEQAVAREVAEEVGLSLTAVEYMGSQPWPFPHSLMIGFRSVAAEGEVRLGAEVREARWFTRAQLRAGVDAGELSLPTPFSISRSLVDDWLEEG